jgi:branched-chain amino acid aminotransferase
MWKRLKDAGFDEQSIKNRDKAALIAYIAKLESEVYDYQHNMGLLLLEKNELSSQYEEIKASVDESDLTHMREKSAYVSALAEAKKREESLKKDVGIAKECISSLEKTLHEMRAECAETKVSAGSTMSEAHVMIEDALKKLADAEAKMRAAEALQAEANRYHRIAERKLKEVESREDDLTRRLASFKSE